jgi:CoA:oxalate CoA-transferase
LSDPQVLHRSMVLELQDGTEGSVRVAGNPIKFRGEPERSNKFPPPLGADNIDILTRVLKLDPKDIERVAKSGALGPDGKTRVLAALGKQ